MISGGSWTAKHSEKENLFSDQCLELRHPPSLEIAVSQVSSWCLRSSLFVKKSEQNQSQFEVYQPMELDFHLRSMVVTTAVAWVSRLCKSHPSRQLTSNFNVLLSWVGSTFYVSIIYSSMARGKRRNDLILISTCSNQGVVEASFLRHCQGGWQMSS